MSQQETEKSIKRVLNRMKELKISQQRRFDELSEHQAQKIQEILGKLAAHFKSEETIKRFCEWSVGKVPAALATWKETKGEALKYVSRRTHQFVQDWEDDTDEFKKAQVELIQYFLEKYDLMEAEIRKVENEAFLDDSQAYGSQDEEVPRSKSQKTAAPLWLRQGLASVVVGSPRVVGNLVVMLKTMAHYKTKLEAYTDDPCDYMSRRSRKCLKVIATQGHLLPFINEQLEDAVQFRKQITEKIPKLMEGDEQLYQQLLEDKRNKAEIQELYEPLNRQMEGLKRSITVYNLTEVRNSDFTKDELKCDEKWESIIGNGNFSTVYKGVLVQEGKPAIKVALKRYRDPLTTQNVGHFVDEERALRQLAHPNIVKFYGTNLQHGPNGATVMIVLELCNCSLKSQVMPHPENAPARLPNEAVKKKVLAWAQNILGALRYIHSEGFVHRDLKLENILLTHDGRVKLADVGVAKHEKDITGTVCGTPLYLAPEVYNGQIYNSKADMYSFGFVLWELWYGETAFQAAISIKTQSVLLKEVMRGGLRPSHVKDTEPPWGIWQDVMMTCWNNDPRLRPTAQKALESLKQLDDRGALQQKKPPPVPPRTAATQPPSRTKTMPPTKPMLPPRPKKPKEAPVSYHRKKEDETVHFEPNEFGKE